MSGGSLTDLEALLHPGQSVLGAWDFLASSGYTPGDPAYLSFDIRAGYDRDGLLVWHYDGSNWSQYAATDLTCNGSYASFTVTGFSGYAVSGIMVPEPGELALLLTAGLALLAWARRKRA